MQPLSKQELHDTLRRIIDARNWRLCVTLTSGDLLFGDFFANYTGAAAPEGMTVHLPSFWDEGTRQLGFALSIEPFDIIYNADEGTVHGSALTLTIPESLVASVETVSWDVLAETGFKNVPNPYATLIEAHNREVAERLGLTIHDYIECALATPHLSERGIEFSREQVLYVDYEYFERLPSSSWSVGGFGIAAEVGRGIQTLVLNALRRGFLARLHEYGLTRYEGYVQPATAEISTEIEGDEWLLFFVKTGFPTLTEELPVLLKRRAISYPREFWPYIASALTVVGELREMPIAHAGRVWPEALAARAIAFLPK